MLLGIYVVKAQCPNLLTLFKPNAMQCEVVAVSVLEQASEVVAAVYLGGRDRARVC